MPRVLVTPTLMRNVPGRYYDLLLAAGFEIVYPEDTDDTMDRPTLIRCLQGVDAMLASTERMDREFLKTTRLRVIARLGVGYDSIDIPGATDLGIAVTITPGTLEESVAEHTIALMLGVSRGIVARHNEVTVDRLVASSDAAHVGTHVWHRWPWSHWPRFVPRLKGLGMRIVAADPFADLEFVKQNQIDLVPLETLLETADVVSLHSPSNADTANLINARTLARMKRGAILINTSRGALVDEDALAAALQNGHLMGAALDVFKVEPLPTSSPLMQCPTALLCSHMGGLDHESVDAASTLAAQCIVDLYENRWPEACVVNRDLRGKFKWQEILAQTHNS
jgi:D-3-phosphoglycerate dehydrogenase / 2-oxoglutarate reductase